jgi:hypothetical protein
VASEVPDGTPVAPLRAVRPHVSCTHQAMHYDDQARRYNLYAGMALGVILGAGVGLILAAGGVRPQRRPGLLPRRPSRARRHSLARTLAKARR